MCSRVCVFAVVGLYLGSRDSSWTDRVSETIHFLRLHGIVLLHLRLFGSEASCWGIFHFIFVFTGILATSIVKSLVHCLLDGRSEIQQQAGFILLTITTGRRSSRTRGSLQTCTWCWSESGASGTVEGKQRLRGVLALDQDALCHSRRSLTHPLRSLTHHQLALFHGSDEFSCSWKKSAGAFRQECGCCDAQGKGSKCCLMQNIGP